MAVRAYADTATPGPLFFAVLIVVSVLHEVAGTLVFVSMMSFFAKVSDPAIGGTYMTLLNTIANLGAKWPNSSALYFLSSLTYARCVPDAKKVAAAAANLAEKTELVVRKISKAAGLTAAASLSDFSAFDCHRQKAECIASNGMCKPDVDGYTVETFVCFGIGVIWLLFFRRIVLYLQSVADREWHVTASSMKASMAGDAAYKKSRLE